MRSKIISLTGALRRTNGCIPIPVCRTIYNALVNPHLEYLLEVWGNAAKTHLKYLQTAQNKATKTLFRYNYLTPTTELYNKTKLFNLNQMYFYKTCILIKKITTKAIHSDIIFTKKNHRYFTRNNNKFNLTTPRTNYGKRNIMFEGVQMFNKLPKDVVETDTITTFKKKLKNYLLSNQV